MNYKVGRNNLSATIFVPWDCSNNCPFCTSKKDYLDTSNFNLSKIFQTTLLLNNNKNIKEYVITGGEPFADPDKLKLIIACCEKPVYINTSLPQNTLNNAIEIINTNDKIKGINVSRHIGFNFDCVATLDDLDRINKSIRINTVINKNFTFDKFIEFVEYYGKKKRDINLRADYRKVTETTLKSRDKIQEFLAEKYDFIDIESCFVCESEYYSYNNQFLISYHRGLEHSSVQFGNTIYINDVLIKQDGNIYKDWDCITDKDFNEWILKG